MDDVAFHQVEELSLGQLHPHPENYRRHPAAQLEHLAQSLRENGLYRNIVVARDGTILAGHGVYEAALLIGLERIRVIRLDLAYDEPKALKILTGDNELGKIAEVDDRLLAQHLRTISELDELLGTGYDESMLANLVYVTRPESEIASLDQAAEWAAAGMPEFEKFDAPHRVVVSLDTPEDREKLLEVLGVEVINRKDRETWSVRWPPRPKEDLSSVFFEPGEISE